MNRWNIYTAGVLGLVLHAGAWANDGAAPAQRAADKSQFHLFNATPDELMRPLSADRPDGTESPYTVDAGHVQIEASFFDDSFGASGGIETRVRTFADVNFKLGLTNDIDLQIVFSPSVEERVQVPGMPEMIMAGASDVTVRSKFNIWGNDGGESAFALMPFVTIPTSTDVSNGEWEGGLIAAFGMDLCDGVGLGLMLEGDIAYNDATGSHDFDLIHTAVLGFDVVGPVGCYVEYIGAMSSDSDVGYRPVFSTGLTVALNESAVLDVGLRRGFGRAEEDLGVFAGMTVRF